MNRDKWEFEYTAKHLAVAAKQQQEFRASRVEAWAKKKGEVMQKIKDAGISVSETPADMYANTGKYGGSNINRRNAEIVIDTTLQDDLSECVNKIREHEAMKNAYSAWVQVLEANPDARVKLVHDDWMFFFGK